MSFTRWGRTTCPNTQGTELLYEGIVAGSYYPEAGSAEYLCLHREPQLLRITPGLQNRRARLYATEYRSVDNPPAFSNMLDHDAPCAVCYTPTRNTKITIPGRTSCPPSWTREYYGYLMADNHGTHHQSRVPVCVDLNPESIGGSAPRARLPSMFYFIETTCSGLCPPYSNGAELTCVVCTK